MATVLIAEDDQLIARMYQKIFEFDGYKVNLAGNGQEALDQARTDKPTVILLDIMMPVLNGLAALEKLKADPELKPIPVIMLTNLAGDMDVETALTKGAVKYIVKSEKTPRQVADMVKEILIGYTRNEIPKTESH